MRKKIIFTAIYRSPNQNNEQLTTFMDTLQILCDNLQRERPYSIIMTGDFNCRSSQWRGEDTENLEGNTLDELLERNSLHQTNIRSESLSCIDLVITDQPGIFVESGCIPHLMITVSIK